jgi:hypothetical protein
MLLPLGMVGVAGAVLTFFALRPLGWVLAFSLAPFGGSLFGLVAALLLHYLRPEKRKKAPDR